MRPSAPLFFACVMAFPLAAQEAKPLSAIDWLSQSVQPVAPNPVNPAAPKKIDEAPVATAGGVPQVSVMSLDAPSPDPIGLVPSDVSGLPRTLWAKSEVDTLTALLGKARIDTLPAVQDLMMTLLLAQADAPIGADATGALFLARIDKLLDIGALDPAFALLEQVDPRTPTLFTRWLDVALLTGREDKACTMMKNTPSVAPTVAARIFCTARNGDWPAAALTLNTHRALGDITPEEEALLSRFLDPDLYENEPALAAPTRLSPLVFRMREAIGQSMPTTRLPNAFAHSDLRNTTGWKSQLEAAERLSRLGAISENVLLAQYTARKPAASGGVWDRARAVQKLDRALIEGDTAAIDANLPDAWLAMKDAKLEVPFARIFAPELAKATLTGQSGDIAYTTALLTDAYEAAAQAKDDTDFLTLLAQGIPSGATTSNGEAVQAAFDGAVPPAELEALALNGLLGEAILESMIVFNAGLDGNYTAITDALAFWRSIGLEDVARRAALQLMILDRAP